MLGAEFTLVVGSQIEAVRALMLPVAAGALIYVATSDLVPSLRWWAGPRAALAQTALMVSGIATTSLPKLME